MAVPVALGARPMTMQGLGGTRPKTQGTMAVAMASAHEQVWPHLAASPSVSSKPPSFPLQGPGRQVMDESYFLGLLRCETPPRATGSLLSSQPRALLSLSTALTDASRPLHQGQDCRAHR